MSIWNLIFGKIVAVFIGIFHGSQGAIKKYMPSAITWGNILYAALNSKEAKSITDFIPGEWDEKLRQDGIKILAASLQKATQLEPCLSLATPTEIIDCIIAKFKSANDPLAIKALTHTSTAIAGVISSNDELPWKAAAATLESDYQYNKDK